MENMTVGEIVEKARKEKGLSKNQLAKQAEVSHTEIARIENGDREVPNPKVLKKISKYIGVNYNDLMYAAGLGAKISPLNPYLIEYYSNLKGEELKEAMDSIEKATQNNKIVIESLKNSVDKADDEKKEILLDTIEDLEYQNDTNNEIMKLLNGIAIKEFRNGK